MNPAEHTRQALDYLRTRLRSGDAGKTLMVGLRAGQPRLAIAAGLRGAKEHPNFITLGSYLLRREAADAYWLALPAVTGSDEFLALEIRVASESHVACCPARFADTPADCTLKAAEAHPAEPLLADLLHQTSPVPGRMRRSLDELALVFGVPLPVVDGDV